MNIVKFLRTLILKNICQRLFLIFLGSINDFFPKKQPMKVFYKKVFLQISEIHRKATALECFLNEVAGVRQIFFKKVHLKISQYSLENTCVGVSLLIQLQVCKFIKKRFQDMCFSVNMAKFLLTAISQNTYDGCFCQFRMCFQSAVAYLELYQRCLERL